MAMRMEVPTTPVPLTNTKSYKVLDILQTVVLICVVLYFGKTLFIPLSFALLIGFMLYPACKWMEQKGMNRMAAITTSMMAVSLLFGAVVYLLWVQFSNFLAEWQGFKAKLLNTFVDLTTFVTDRFGISAERQVLLIKKVIADSGGQVVPLLRSTAYSLSDAAFYLILMLVFTALILAQRRLLAVVLYRIFPANKSKVSKEILVETIHAYYNFVKGMLLVYLIVGTLNSIGLAIIGVSHPVLFGFVASVLTFIPYVGIMIASLLPITVSWMEYNSVWYPIGVIGVFSLVQLLEAYVIFPLAVGTRLKINTLAIIVTIVLGGILWGAAGMILFIPFVSILKLIADRTKGLSTLSLLLGDNTTSEIN